MASVRTVARSAIRILRPTGRRAAPRPAPQSDESLLWNAVDWARAISRREQGHPHIGPADVQLVASEDFNLEISLEQADRALRSYLSDAPDRSGGSRLEERP